MKADSTPALSLPQGFIPVMLTPFHDDGTIDYDGLRALTELYIEAGAAGLFANCLSSEMYELTEQERLDITSIVVAQAAGRVPVVATGTFPGSVEEQAGFIKRIYITGVQAVIVISGLMAGEHESEEVFLQNMERLFELTDQVPLGLYECPVPYKRLINSSQLTRLLQSGRLVYLKDTCLDIEEVRRRIKVANGYHFGLYDAFMEHAAESLLAGAAGLSCIQGNIYPELIVWLCRHYNDPGRQEEVSRVQHFFTNSMELVHTAYPTIAKYSLQKRGFPISTYTRREVEALTPELKEKMDALLDEVHQLQAELGIKSIFGKNVAHSSSSFQI